MDLFTQPTGEELKQAGMKQAVEHADEVVPTWSEKAYAHFLAYMEAHPNINHFKTEDVRVYAEEKGFEIPPTKRAWGAIAARVARAGIIKRSGYVPCDNPKAHRGLISLWSKVNELG